MKWPKTALVLVLAMSGVMASESVWAHGGRVRFGVFVGGPVFWPGHYYPPYYYPPYYPTYYPPVVVTPPSPPTYIEQGSSQTAPAQGNWWYYCAEAKAYYPYAKECPAGWQRVAPQPAS